MSALIHYDSTVSGPAAHAIIIGVGDYPHLLGGTGTVWNGHEDMGQLTSTPVSARAFADWLIDPERGYLDNGRRLKSVRLLLSEECPQPYRNLATGADHAVPAATLDTVDPAIKGWAREFSSEGDLAIFFFAGHGITTGIEQALLLERFGDADNFAVGKDAIRFSGLTTGMKWMPPRDQWYILDACRSYSKAHSRRYGGVGESIIDPDPDKDFDGYLKQAVLNATLEGAPAYGRKGRTSVFTEALLQALEGGGSDDLTGPGDWRLYAGQIGHAVEFIVRRTALRAGLGQKQLPVSEGPGSLHIGKLRGNAPMVPVELCCTPDDATAMATFWFNEISWQRGQPDPLIEFGDHEFMAAFEGGLFPNAVLARSIRPPYRRVAIDLKGLVA